LDNREEPALICIKSVTCENAARKTVSPRIQLGQRKGIGILLGDAAIDQLRSHFSSCHIMPIEESGRPSIRKANLEAPALRNGLVFDQSDFHAP
jgi:hypothetical protein